MIASAWRPNWTVAAADKRITYENRILELRKDPPVVVRAEVDMAVRRSTDKQIFSKLRHLEQLVKRHGVFLRTLLALLAAGSKAALSSELKGGLRSAFANGQWPHDHRRGAGWAQHDQCQLCVRAPFDKRKRNEIPPATASTTASTPSFNARTSDFSQKLT